MFKAHLRQACRNVRLLQVKAVARFALDFPMRDTPPLGVLFRCNCGGVLFTFFIRFTQKNMPMRRGYVLQRKSPLLKPCSNPTAGRYRPAFFLLTAFSATPAVRLQDSNVHTDKESDPCGAHPPRSTCRCLSVSAALQAATQTALFACRDV
jgi:hypothetical protein